MSITCGGCALYVADAICRTCGRDCCQRCRSITPPNALAWGDCRRCLYIADTREIEVYPSPWTEAARRSEYLVDVPRAVELSSTALRYSEIGRFGTELPLRSFRARQASATVHVYRCGATRALKMESASTQRVRVALCAALGRAGFYVYPFDVQVRGAPGYADVAALAHDGSVTLIEIAASGISDSKRESACAARALGARFAFLTPGIADADVPQGCGSFDAVEPLVAWVQAAA
jgi:hypothetical protein